MHNKAYSSWKLPQNVVLEISVDAKKFYCGWSGDSSRPLQPNSVFGPNAKLDVLEIDPQLGTTMGLQEGQKVIEWSQKQNMCLIK